jgi:hypothetical protein
MFSREKSEKKKSTGKPSYYWEKQVTVVVTM